MKRQKARKKNIWTRGLEPCAVKAARTVLRGGCSGNGGTLLGSATRSVDNQYGVIPSGLPNDLPLSIHAMSRI